MINRHLRKECLSKIIFFFLLLSISLVGLNCYSAVSHGFFTEVNRVENGFSLPQQALEAFKKNLPAKPLVTKFSFKKNLLVVLNFIFILMALSGAIPVIAFFIEHNLAILHTFINHLRQCKDYTPKTAIIIPAWNEGSVLVHTINLLLKMDYPLSALRVYVVDDGSTDNTPALLAEMQQAHPDNVFPLRNQQGGKGKAHAINFGLSAVLSDSWAQAIMIIDADISFKKDALRRLARHLADPQVGAVTAYIKEGTRKDNYITRSIGYEYIVSQSIARRAQNVLGVVACLAGGAQLHTRANIELLGGKIDTSTLAEDTYTTLETQRLGKKVIFEGNAFVYAEEPKSIVEVWKQRYRWARGNIQITRAFKKAWFRHSKQSRLGSLLFGIIWFCVLLTPQLMICTSLGLLGLYAINKEHSAHIFYYLASVSLFVYLYTTLFAIIADRKTSRIAWLEGITYPGIISLAILILSVNPDFFFMQTSWLFNMESAPLKNGVLFFIETWIGLCMFWAWFVYRLELSGVSSKVTNCLLLIIGYGPLLCAINFVASLAEWKKLNLRWDKTEKLGNRRVVWPRPEVIKKFDFDSALAKDLRREKRFFCQGITSLATVSLLFCLFYLYYF